MKTLSWLERSALKLARVKVKTVKWSVGMHFSKLKIEKQEKYLYSFIKEKQNTAWDRQLSRNGYVQLFFGGEWLRGANIAIDN